MWDLWWTKYHWDRFFSKFFHVPLSVSFHHCFIFTHVSSRGWTTGLLAATVPLRQSPPITTITMFFIKAIPMFLIKIRNNNNNNLVILY
jgi:hypothetical protein